MEASQLGKGKRVRKKVNYLDPAGQALGVCVCVCVEF